MVATIIASVALIMAGIALYIAWGRELNKPAKPLTLADMRRVNAPLFGSKEVANSLSGADLGKGYGLNPSGQPVDSLSPLRKRPGIGTLRHKAEMESLQPTTDAEKRVAKNTTAMQGVADAS